MFSNYEPMFTIDLLSIALLLAAHKPPVGGDPWGPTSLEVSNAVIYIYAR